MKIRYPNLILLILSLFEVLFPVYAAAQDRFSTKITDNWIVGFNGGATMQIGELGSFGGKSIALKNAATVYLGKQVFPYFTLRASLMAGSFKGQDLVTFSKAQFFSYQLAGQLSFLNLFNGYKPGRTYDLFAMVGGGFIDFQSDIWDIHTLEWLGGYGHGYGKGIKGYTREWVIPAGLGFQWNFYRNLSLNFETSYLYLNTDYIDAADFTQGKDKGLYSSLGFSYRFNVGRLHPLEPLNYQTSADKVSFKYRNLSFLQGKTRHLRDGAKPTLEVEIPPKIGAVDSFNIKLSLKNDGVSGVADIDVVIPQGFSIKLPKGNGIESTFDELVGNIYTTLPPSDTALQLKLIVYSGQAPVGSHPFYVGYKVIDATGETTGEKKVYYIEKDLMHSPDGKPLVDKMMGVDFRVQLTASRTRIAPEKLALLYPIKEKIYEDFSDGFYQYTAGSFKTAQDADRYKEKLVKDLGLSDLYVVFFQNGIRISTLKGAETGREYIRTYTPSSKGSGTSSISQPQKVRPSEYRVEIRRNDGNPLKISDLKAMFETPEPITEIYHEGVYYYFAGSFPSEDIARAYREYLSDRYGMVSARVVAISKGRLLVNN